MESPSISLSDFQLLCVSHNAHAPAQTEAYLNMSLKGLIHPGHDITSSSQSYSTGCSACSVMLKTHTRSLQLLCKDNGWCVVPLQRRRMPTGKPMLCLCNVKYVLMVGKCIRDSLGTTFIRSALMQQFCFHG